MAVELFDRDDDAYLDWISKHRFGFVVNGRRSLDPGYLVLHRAACAMVSAYPDMDENPGGFTERAYIKYCAESRNELARFLAGLIGSKHPFSKECSLCKPE